MKLLACRMWTSEPDSEINLVLVNPELICRIQYGHPPNSTVIMQVCDSGEDAGLLIREDIPELLDAIHQLTGVNPVTEAESEE